MENFNEEEYIKRLIERGLSPVDAAVIAARTAAAQNPPARPPRQPHDAGRGQRTAIEAVTDQVSNLALAKQDGAMKKRGKTATEALAGAVEQAEQEAMLKHTKNQIKDLQLSLFDIAPWGDTMRGMPNDFARSALFTVRNKRVPREDLENEAIFHVMKDVKITYSGPELRAYDDELVWLQVMEYSKRVPIGEPVTFTLYEFCKDLGWPVNGRYYDKIEECLTRLQRTALKISSKRVGRLESISLIRRFGFLDQTDKRKSRCQVFLEDEIVILFAGDHYAKFVWGQYRQLSAITRRLFDYFSSHKEPFPLSLESFRLMCKSDTTLTKKWRQQATASCDELQKSGLVKAVWIKSDLVYCER